MQFATRITNTGICMLSVHPRTKQEKSYGAAHWLVPRELSASDDVTVPVNVSGDCFSVRDAVAIHTYCRPHGILISRGAMHNPGIFDDIKQ